MNSLLNQRWRHKSAVYDHSGALRFGKEIIVIGQGSDAKRKLLDRVKESGVALRLLACVPVGQNVRALPPRSRILVDVEALGGIEETIDDLLALRHLRPDLVVVLLSKDFARDSFDETRLAVADACVKFPTTIKTLSQAFSEAQRNNDSWNVRQFALVS